MNEGDDRAKHASLVFYLLLDPCWYLGELGWRPMCALAESLVAI
jgi:hypothetical protein